MVADRRQTMKSLGRASRARQWCVKRTLRKFFATDGFLERLDPEPGQYQVIGLNLYEM